MPQTLILTKGRDLGAAYAEALRVIESPLPILRYAESLSTNSGSPGWFVFLVMSTGFALLIAVCVVLFGPTQSMILDMILFLLIGSIVAATLVSRLGQKVIWPIALRLLTVDYLVKVLVHQHVRRHLTTLARQYRGLLLQLPDQTPLEKPVLDLAESFEQMVKRLLNLRSVVYISAPPLLLGLGKWLIELLDLRQFVGEISVWLIPLSFIYVIYTFSVCFSQKRQILLGAATWSDRTSETQLYKLEDSAYDAVGVTKKREIPLDFVLWGGSCAVLVGLVILMLVTKSGPSFGIVLALGGGPVANSVIPIFGGILGMWICWQRWKIRKSSASA